MLMRLLYGPRGLFDSEQSLPSVARGIKRVHQPKYICSHSHSYSRETNDFDRFHLVHRKKSMVHVPSDPSDLSLLLRKFAIICWHLVDCIQHQFAISQRSRNHGFG